MNRFVKKYKINKVSQFNKSSEIYEYIMKCYNSNKSELDYIYQMIEKCLGKLQVQYLCKIYFNIPLDNNLKSMINQKMFNYYDKRVIYNYVLSDSYYATRDDEINLLTSIFKEKSEYELNSYCKQLSKNEKFYNGDIPTIVIAACNCKKANVMYSVALESDNLSKESINLLTYEICKMQDSRYLYMFVRNVNNLSDDNIYMLISSICNLGDAKYIYKLSLEFKKYEYMYKKTLLESNNLYYLTLYSLYVDNSLIKDIFLSPVRMIEYMKLEKFEINDIRYASQKFNYDVDEIYTMKDEINKNIKKMYLELSVNNQ